MARHTTNNYETRVLNISTSQILEKLNSIKNKPSLNKGVQTDKLVSTSGPQIIKIPGKFRSPTDNLDINKTLTNNTTNTKTAVVQQVQIGNSKLWQKIHANLKQDSILSKAEHNKKNKSENDNLTHNTSNYGAEYDLTNMYSATSTPLSSFEILEKYNASLQDTAQDDLAQPDAFDQRYQNNKHRRAELNYPNVQPKHNLPSAPEISINLDQKPNLNNEEDNAVTRFSIIDESLQQQPYIKLPDHISLPTDHTSNQVLKTTKENQLNQNKRPSMDTLKFNSQDQALLQRIIDRQKSPLPSRPRSGRNRRTDKAWKTFIADKLLPVVKDIQPTITETSHAIHKQRSMLRQRISQDQLAASLTAHGIDTLPEEINDPIKDLMLNIIQNSKGTIIQTNVISGLQQVMPNGESGLDDEKNILIKYLGCRLTEMLYDQLGLSKKPIMMPDMHILSGMQKFKSGNRAIAAMRNRIKTQNTNENIKDAIYKLMYSIPAEFIDDMFNVFLGRLTNIRQTEHDRKYKQIAE